MKRLHWVFFSSEYKATDPAHYVNKTIRVWIEWCIDSPSIKSEYDKVVSQWPKTLRKVRADKLCVCVCVCVVLLVLLARSFPCSIKNTTQIQVSTGMGEHHKTMILFGVRNPSKDALYLFGQKSHKNASRFMALMSLRRNVLSRWDSHMQNLKHT